MLTANCGKKIKRYDYSGKVYVPRSAMSRTAMTRGFRPRNHPGAADKTSPRHPSLLRRGVSFGCFATFRDHVVALLIAPSDTRQFGALALSNVTCPCQTSGKKVIDYFSSTYA